MRIFTFLLLFFASTAWISAQKVVINSPAEIAGSIDFTNPYEVSASWNIDLTTDVWTADAVLVNDGSANPTFGCNPIQNAAAIAGKIALIDRGTCSFTVKVCNAQTAGALAVVIMNSAANAGAGPGPAGYTAGICDVSIPWVHISYEDGLKIKDALTRGAVNISIGNIKVAEDIGSGNEQLMRPANGVVPASQVDEADDFLLYAGAEITNRGSNNVSGVNLNAQVVHVAPDGSFTTVYDENASGGDLMVDSSVFVLMDNPYDAGVNGLGIYEVTYTVSHALPDGDAADNEFLADFAISDNVFCKGSWDYDNNRPYTTNAYTRLGGGPIEFLTGYYVKNGLGYSLDSVHFYCSVPTGDSLGGKTVTAFVYEWTDLNFDGQYNNDEFTVVALNSVTFEGNARAGYFTLPLYDFDFNEGYKIPGDDKYYVLGIRYEGDGLFYWGFDESFDLEPYLSLLSANQALSDFDWPYLGVNAWDNGLPTVESAFYFTDLFASAAQGLYINKLSSTNDILTNAELNMFPNPANDQLTTTVKLDETATSLEYRITDAQGRLLFNLNRRNVSEDKAIFRVATLPNGTYYLTIRTENGILTKPFNVSR
jgi:hypothetical protein